jgi:hypothetical protein
MPLTDIDAPTRLTTTLCDVLETTLAVLPAPANEAVALPDIRSKPARRGEAGVHRSSLDGIVIDFCSSQREFEVEVQHL